MVCSGSHLPQYFPLASCRYDTVETERGPRWPRGTPRRILSQAPKSRIPKSSDVKHGRGYGLLEEEIHAFLPKTNCLIIATQLFPELQFPLRPHPPDTLPHASPSPCFRFGPSLDHPPGDYCSKGIGASNPHREFYAYFEQAFITGYLSSTRGSKLKGAHERPA